jgi:hypothetical protein
VNFFNRFFALLALCFFGLTAFGQTNSLTQTTLSSAVVKTDKVINVTSATGINAPSASTPASELYVMAPGNPRGEVMLVQAVSGTTITVARGRQGAQTDFPSGSIVLIGQPNWFRDYDPSGGCTLSLTYVAPWVNTKTGQESLCSSVTNSWVPGFGSPSGDAFAPTAAVASAAGLITPSGPLFHVTGTAAITGFNVPVGFNGGSFTVIPDGIFTTTTANNIALASTAVVSKPLTFTYDPNTAKFYPSY